MSGISTNSIREFNQLNQRIGQVVLLDVDSHVLDEIEVLAVSLVMYVLEHVQDALLIIWTLFLPKDRS